MKEGEAEFYIWELFQDIPNTVGCLWKNLSQLDLDFLSKPLVIQITKSWYPPLLRV